VFGYFVFFTAFCLLLILLCLSVPVQVTDWKDSEMTYNVLMGTLNPTHSLTHSLGAPSALCRSFTGRTPQSGVSRCLDLLRGRNSAIFAPQGRLVAPIHVKFGTAKGHLGPLDLANFHANRCMGVGTRPPKLQKIPLFWLRVAPQGRTL